MDGIRELRKGEVIDGIPADGWNYFLKWCQRMERMKGQGNGPGVISSQFPSIEVFNKTGADIEAAFPILKLSPTLTIDNGAHVDREPILFDGETPDADTDIGDIAILQGPVKNDDSVWAIFVGYSWVDVDVTDEGHTHASPSDGDNAKLESGGSGAPIVWKGAGTGVLRCLVKLGGGGGGTSTIRAGQVTTEITAATGPLAEQWGSGQIKLQDESTGELAGASITVHNDWIGTAFVVDAQVKVDMAHDPPRVLTGTCDAVSWDLPE